ncbi:FAD-dependent oxidoreductase [Raoultibacter phocaeensis]|uniref:FAD-dependent oxidoreductase n=1 Tax=Raoultibacter phocaeensis TaxID=2479841 RepID=UPI00111B7837|nr:FAD-binding protein [Raoultibacter phocaeensis]
MKELTRRNFLLGSSVAAAGIMGAGVLAACSPGAEAPTTEAKAEEPALKEATQTKEADVVVAGLGAAGLLAAYGAASNGCTVIAVDAAASMDGTTNTRTSAAFAVGSKLQEPSPEPLTIEEFMAYVNTGTNYQSNNKALRAIIEASGKAVDVFVDAGMPFNVDFTNSTSADPMMVRGGCVYGVAGEERAAYFTKIVDDAGVECLFNTAAESLIVENGTVTGLQCISGKDVIDIKAKAVVLATGGFLGSEEETAKHFAGAKIVNMGNILNTGAGITMAMDAGAQIGKCFSISMNEYGGANTKASPTYSFRPTSGTNEAMRLPVFGGILLDGEGDRFVNEGVMCEKTMFCCEPLVRESYYYAVCDEAFMKRWETEPLPTFLGDERMKGMFADVVATDIREQFDKAVDEGWAFKADTLAELGEHFGLSNLEQTVAQYNEYCATGADELFFKDAKYLTPIEEGPFYIVESMPAGWLSLGGIKCNARCQAVDADNKVVQGLYVAGADADLFTSPYYAAGSANGFAVGSGLIAGEEAAKTVRG